MSVRRSAWSVYDIFDSADGERIFVGVVSDTLWQRFCEEFELTEFAADRSLDDNNERVKQRDRILPIIEALFASMDKPELTMRLDRAGIPFAPINRPADLFDDPHLNASGGLQDVTLTDPENLGVATRLPSLPVEMGGEKFALRQDIPREGEHTRQVMREVGYNEAEIESLLSAGLVRAEV
jgi:crotonobetainyl-CoA:carnitine CoA-transferase CaiB-like acyl-CoA transferase